MRILFDVTTQGGESRLPRALGALGRAVPAARRRKAPSGLRRVGQRLLATLDERAETTMCPVRWQREALTGLDGAPVAVTSEDVFFTAELMSPAERPGFEAFVRSFPGRRVALFHDAIPLKHPAFAWPKAAARHPAYMALLNSFDHVACVSDAARADLEGWWQWIGQAPRPTSVLALGADLAPERVTRTGPPKQSQQLVALGIMETRKGQDLLLDACERLWQAGSPNKGVHLTLIGRVNPHHGMDIAARAAHLSRNGRPLLHLTGADDARVLEAFANATLSVFPSRAEGLGLPVLESLWLGVPCVASDIAPHRESAAAGGCALFPAGDSAALASVLGSLLRNEGERETLAREAMSRSLPTWAACADALVDTMESTHRLS